MTSINAHLELGKKRVFAGAVDWPGWCRSGGDEAAALQTLVDYGKRYATAMHGSGIQFITPTDTSELVISERHQGNVSTDYGAPAVILDADRSPVQAEEHERLQMILDACWQAFDFALECAMGVELRKGPRGGGRDLDQMVEHVLEADRAYLKRIAWSYKRERDTDQVEELGLMRSAIRTALDVALNLGLPDSGPRGGVIWPARYFVRRVAWHALDHAWEIEDRSG